VIKLIDLLEKKMTSTEKKEKETLVKGMKKAKGDFKKRYGKDAKSVMYATATKRAMDEKLDAVGKEDSDIDNDGDTDKTDKYLLKRRKAIAANIKEGPSKANILGIDFNITEMNGRIFFSFIDKKAASVKIREIGSNEIVNRIQKSLDKAYGKGEFFFKSGDHAEFQNGYLFQRNPNNVDLNKLKFESSHDDHEVSMAVSSLEAIAEAIIELRQKLGNSERNIPGWIQDHISKAENYIEQAAQGFHELSDNE
jgi:hypothetical protein